MTTITLTVAVGTQQWTPPADCATLDLIEMWGPGGSGGTSPGTSRVTGGGAGAYNAVTGPITVSSLLVAGTVPFEIGQRGAAVNSSSNTNGNPGTAKTWFSAVGTYAADIGLGGVFGASGTTAGGAGGLVANCVPTGGAKAGGNGGTCSNAGGASGGGASGSSAGVGVNAAAVSTAALGAGATAPSGGGNGGAGALVGNGASALAPGGGGGSTWNGPGGSSGRGGHGQIILTYTPSTDIYPLPSVYLQRVQQMQAVMTQ